MKARFNHSIGFGLSLFFLLISTAASYINADNLLKTSRLVNQTDSISKARLNFYMAYIPMVIIASALIGMVITIILYWRVRNDFRERTRLQQELKKNEQDLQRRIEIIQEIQTRGEELALGTKYKSEFLTNMSHELRTPLNSILLLSGLMANNTDKTLKEEYIEYAKVIQSSGEGLLELIDEILDLSKIESGKTQLYFEDVSVGEIMQIVKELFIQAASQKKIELLMYIDAAAQITIQTDRMRLEQVINNLISNAIKFTPAGGKVSISVFKPSNQNGFIAFAVKDTGIGIAVEKQQVIFEAFQQADASTQRQYGGTGLGLSISSELIKLLGGRIILNSEPGTGSEFIIYIPCTRLVEENSAGAVGLVELPGNPGVTLEHLEGKTALIVDDDVRSIFSITKALEAFKMNIVSALDGKEALLQLEQNPQVNIILMDMIMPEMDGYESMISIRKDPALKDLPIIAVTANAMKGDREKCLKAGASDYIAKPVDIEKLVSLLHVWL